MNNRIVVLTGAGISAESGIKTFRDHNGLWENHRIEDVATPEAFERDPKLVHNFYNLRRAQLKQNSVQPNAAHIALSSLEQKLGDRFLLVTQNVDNLHARAGNKNLIHMHGQLDQIFCVHCDKRTPWLEDLSEAESCPSCKKPSSLRPDIVWFGEIPYRMDEIETALENSDIFIAVGTSSQVYPAAGFVRIAKSVGAQCFECNMEPTPASHFYDKGFYGPATIELPKLISALKF